MQHQPVRQDILSITPEKLIHIANTGLLKRARKATENGNVPKLTLSKENTLVATFPDGHQVTWLVNQSLTETDCTCPAPMCRHRVQTVICYRQQYDNPVVNIISPHLISATHVLATCNKPTLTKAKNLCASGITLKIIPTETCPKVILPMATISFWGGKNINEATCDCILKQGCEHIALASVAYAQLTKAPSETIEFIFTKSEFIAFFNASNPAKSDTQRVNKKTEIKKQFNHQQSVQKHKLADNVTTDSEYHALTTTELNLFISILNHGIIHGSSRYQRQIDDVLAALKKSKEIWLQAILNDLKEWMQAYQNRRTDFKEEKGYQLIAEYLTRSIARKNSTLASTVLGVGLKHETLIATTQLTSLGARISSFSDKHGKQCYQCTIMFMDKLGTLLSHEHIWVQDSETEQNNKFAQRHIAKQQIAKRINLSTLVYGYVTCHRATRTANHGIKFNSSRITYNQVIPQDGNWQEVLEKLSYHSVASYREMTEKRPADVLSGRYSQPNFIVLPIIELLEHGFNPALQSYQAMVKDVDETIYFIERQHRKVNPHALDIMAHACHQFKTSQRSSVSGFVAGIVTSYSPKLVIEPWSLITDKLYVLDVASESMNHLSALQQSQRVDLLTEYTMKEHDNAMRRIQDQMIRWVCQGGSDLAKIDKNHLKETGYLHLYDLLQSKDDSTLLNLMSYGYLMEQVSV